MTVSNFMGSDICLYDYVILWGLTLVFMPVGNFMVSDTVFTTVSNSMGSDTGLYGFK
jgi:hypothetical protein